MAHVHPGQEERFEILEGTLLFRRGKERIRAEAGDVVTIPAGTAHHFENIGDGPARFVTEIRPALQFEQMIETMFALARDGKTNRRGMPNPLRLAVIARAYFDTVQLPFPPVWMQRTGLALGAAAHGLGTARALEQGEREGAVAALAIGIVGALTAILTPLVLWLLP